MKNPDFWHNQTYKPSCVYNKNEQQVYNEMRICKWWWNQQIKHPLQASIIPILISIDKTIMSLCYGDQRLWPVYITIGNLDAKIWQFQKRPGTLLLGFIPITHKQSEDANNKNKYLKAKIYHMALKTILQYTYSSLPSISWLEKNETLIILQHCLSIWKMELNWYMQTDINSIAILYWQVLW